MTHPAVLPSSRDISDCAREPIHIPGSIQPNGSLLVLEAGSLRVLQVSGNIQEFIGSAPEQVLAKPLAQTLPPRAWALLESGLTAEIPGDVNFLSLELDGGSLDATLHRSEGAILVELEWAEVSRTQDLSSGLDRGLTQLARCDSFDALMRATARTVFELTNFERVMVYRFDEDGNGQVIAEVKIDALEPYLGLRYPESDIPRQAREIYLRNWIRCIPDARYVPVPLMPRLRPDTGSPLDLSKCTLRSVSPVHLEYMANMGVQASMSVSLIVGGRLWGLISAGSRTPHRLHRRLRAACETIGRVVSLQIAAQEALDFRRGQEAKEQDIQQLTLAMQACEAGVLAGLVARPEALLGVVGAAGAAVVLGEEAFTTGNCPPESDLQSLVQWVGDQPLPDGLYQTHALSIDDGQWAPVAGLASGVLAIVLPGATRRSVLWFRPELAHTVKWGGNPYKAVQTNADGDVPRLHPRRSFEEWKQVVKGRAERWQPAELHAAQALRRRAVELDLELQIERERAAVRARDELVAIVSHDLRTPISVVVMQAAIIQRLISQDTDRSLLRFRTAAEMIQRVCGRMNALLNDLLDRAKIEAGRFEVAPVPTRSARLVGDTCELMEALAGAAGITITRARVDDVAVRADPERIYQVFSNLIGNAVKHCAAGSEVRVAAIAADGVCEFSVTDDGLGIPHADHEQIFQRYWQGRQSDSLGAGLGLYIARGIVEAHGGTLRVHSAPSQGATFVFTLPLA